MPPGERNSTANLDRVNSTMADIPSIDFRAWFDGIRQRWWVILITSILGLIVVFAQDSGLRQEPTGDFVVKRIYESATVLDELTLARIDLGSVTPVPSFDNQLLIIQSEETLLALRQVADSQAEIEVTRTEPKFTITETLDESNNYVSFLSTGTPSYVFNCVGEDQSSCDRLIDAYVAKVSDLRKQSVIGGIEDGIRLIGKLVQRTEERITNPSLTADQQTAYRAELASLTTKLDALTEILSSATGDLIPINEFTIRKGKSVASITSLTYGFGAAVGLVLGFFIALQLAINDKRIRHAWQISRLQSVDLLGSTKPRHDERQVTALAASVRRASDLGADSILVLALHDSLMEFGRSVLKLVPTIPGSVVSANDQVSVESLVGTGTTSLLILIKAGVSTREELLEKIGEFTSGGRRLIGVALID